MNSIAQTKTNIQKNADKEAAEWFAKRQGQTHSAEQEDIFQQWLHASSANTLAYEQCKMLWQMSLELVEDNDIQNELSQAKNGKAVHHPVLKVAAAIFLLISIALISNFFLPDKYQTSIGEQRVVVLPDGSTAILNTDTSISVKFDEGQRYIKLNHGEAYFDVIPDKSRSFEVQVEQRIVKAIGTQFNVSVLDDEVNVAVLEGVVVVNDEATIFDESTNFVELEQGEGILFTAENTITEVDRIDMEQVAAWRERKLYFKSAKLFQAVAQYNRYTDIKIKIIDSAIGNEKISGVFNIDDMDSFIFAIETAFDVYVIRNKDGIFLMPRKTQYRASQN